MFDLAAVAAAVAGPDVQRKIKDKLIEKTANQIIAEGNRIIVEQRKQRKKEHEQVLKEIEEVRKKITEIKQKELRAEKDKEELEKFKVLRSRFYFQEDMFSKSPIIELTVQNDTKHPVSRAYFEGVLATPGRSVPWVKDSFNYKIRGGLEPGEKATWKLAPNMFGEWGQAPKDRNDMVLTVTVKRIDGADEKPIFDSEFSRWDKERLEELTKRLEKLKKNLAKLEKELI